MLVLRSRTGLTIDLWTLRQRCFRFRPRSEAASARIGKVVSSYCPNLTSLTSLDRKEEYLESAALAIIIKIPTITYLSLVSTELSEKGLKTILETCESLEHLDISRNKSVTGRCLLLGHAPYPALMPRSLRYLDVSYTACIREYVLEHCQVQCPNLVKLKMAHLDSSQGYPEINAMHSLKYLDISQEYTYSPLHCIPLDLRKFASLEVLLVRGCRLGNDFNELATNCPNLTSLDITDCYRSQTACNVFAQLRGLNNLIELKCAFYMSDVKELSDLQLTVECLCSCKQLKALDLSEWGLLDNECVVQIIMELPMLTSLRINYCRHVTNALEPLLVSKIPELVKRENVLELFVRGTDSRFRSFPVSNLRIMTK